MSPISDQTDLKLVDQIDAVLPQTQCTKCGYPACRPYAEAIARGDAINKCPPGGQSGIDALAVLLDRPSLPLDPVHGVEGPRKVAYIREAECIGCTKCIQVCPVDAIIGAAKLMHTVLVDVCTGCDLCVAPCPVDCIDMLPSNLSEPVREIADLSRQRFLARQRRLNDLAARAPSVRVPEMSSSAVPESVMTSETKPAAEAVTSARPRLEQNLRAAEERLQRAADKVADAEKRQLPQLYALKARYEDIRFKYEEAKRKLAELDEGDAAQLVLSANARYEQAVQKMQALRSQKSDRDRLQSGLAVIDSKIALITQQLPTVTGDEAFFLREDLQRLQAKRELLLEEMRRAESGTV